MTPCGNIVVVEGDPDTVEAVRRELARMGNRSVTVLDDPSAIVHSAQSHRAVCALFGLAQFKAFGRRMYEQIHQIREATKIILVLRERDVMEALDYVELCDGFLFIDRQLDCANEIIELAVHGYCIFPTSLLSMLASHHLRLDILPTLSGNEVKVLVLLGRGLSNRTIARRLGISDSTAKNHVRSVLRKMHFRNRTEAGIFAFRHLLADAETGGGEHLQ